MEIAARALVIYVFLWLVVRGTGKRSLAELTPLELVMIVVLGDLVQPGITQEDMSITGGLIAVSVFVVLTVFTDWLTRRSKQADNLISGTPVIVLQSGEPLMERLAEERLTMDELKEAARIHGFGDLEQVEWAILETDGQFSFIGKASPQ